MPGPIPGFNLLPFAAVEKWHSQEDIDDTPFKRPLRAMMAHHAAVERAEVLVSEIRRARISLLWNFYELVVSVALIIVGSIAGYFVHPYTVVIAVAGAVAGPLFLRGFYGALREQRKLVAEEASTRKEIETQRTLAQQLITAADKKIVDLGPPPDEV